MRQGLKYFAGLVGLYILVANATGTGTLFSQGAQGASGFTRTLQGR